MIDINFIIGALFYFKKKRAKMVFTDLSYKLDKKVARELTIRRKAIIQERNPNLNNRIKAIDALCLN